MFHTGTRPVSNNRQQPRMVVDEFVGEPGQVGGGGDPGDAG
jgi:hypothetical protein